MATGAPLPIDEVRRRLLGNDPDRLASFEASLERQRESRSLYASADGEPVLRHSFVAFIDVLGTRAAMSNFTDDDLRQQIQRLDETRWLVHDETWAGEFQRILSFSDSLVVGSPVDLPLEGGADLGLFITSLLPYILRHAQDGKFHRGGVAFGRLYIDDQLVTGPALVEAVDLEEKDAVFPRVLLSDDCVRLARVDDADFAADYAWMSPWRNELLVDGDGRIFLNYLSSLLDWDDERAVRQALRRHRDAISDQLSSTSQPPTVLQKYRWLAEYHNYVCDEFFPGLSDCKIQDELPESDARMPRQFGRLPRLSNP